MATERTGRSRVTGGQKLFLLWLSVCSVLLAVGFSLFIFGASSEFLATPTDRLYVTGIGLGTMGAGALGMYAALR